MKDINKGLRLIQCIRIIGLLLVLSAGLFLVSPIGQAFTFTTIDVPGSTGTSAAGINPSGQIVGQFSDSKGDGHGFLRDTDGSFTTIDMPGSSGTGASGINSSGQIAGGFTVLSSGVLHLHGFVASP